MELPRTRRAYVSRAPTRSSGTVTVSAPTTASMGSPAATYPSSGRSTARPPARVCTTSTERLRFQARRMKPFSCRFIRCLWTVARDESPNRAPISSRLGAYPRSSMNSLR